MCCDELLCVGNDVKCAVCCAGLGVGACCTAPSRVYGLVHVCCTNHQQVAAHTPDTHQSQQVAAQPQSESLTTLAQRLRE